MAFASVNVSRLGAAVVGFVLSHTATAPLFRIVLLNNAEPLTKSKPQLVVERLAGTSTPEIAEAAEIVFAIGL